MIRLLELFGGIGAPRKALLKANIPIKSIGYVEIDKNAVNSYNAIYGENFEPTDIKTYYIKNDYDINVIFHGSPCQDFSQGGKQLGGIKGSNTRSSLVYETIRIVENIKPKYVVWENVKNITNNKHKEVYNDYLKKMEELGYKNYSKSINSLDFNVPQTRNRIITISILNGTNFIFPKELERETKTKDFLVDNIVEWKQQKNFLTFTNFYTIPRGKDGKLINGSYNRVWNIDKYIGTIPTAVKIKVGYVKDEILYYREITSKEAWLLMGFSEEDYNKAKEVCNQNQLYKQAGNSIVVNVLEAIFKELFKVGE